MLRRGRLETVTGDCLSREGTTRRLEQPTTALASERPPRAGGGTRFLESGGGTMADVARLSGERCCQRPGERPELPVPPRFSRLKIVCGSFGTLPGAGTLGAGGGAG